MPLAEERRPLATFRVDNRSLCAYSAAVTLSIKRQYMSAFFSTFVTNAPDQEGGIDFDILLTVVNETEHPIHQVQYKIWYSDQDGVTLDAYESNDDVFLAPSDSHNITACGRVNKRDMVGSALKARGVGKLARRDFLLLGEVAIPDAGSSTRLTTNLDFSWTSGPLTIILSRSDQDADGNFSLEFKALIDNQSNQYLKVVTLKGQLIDADGVEIENDEEEREIPPETAVLYSSSFYNTNTFLSRLDGAKALFSLKALIPVGSFEATETIEVGEK